MTLLTENPSQQRPSIVNMPQPDGFLMIGPACGGQAKIAGGFVAGAPELIVEIAASSASYDLHEKLRVYRRSGVREYIVWRTYDQELLPCLSTFHI